MTNRAHGHSGFTLFEVAISAVLVTFGVVSVLMLLPSGLKAQQQARYQVHAAVLMQNIAQKFANPAQQHFNVQVEAEKLTNNLFLNRVCPSLESVADGSYLQLAPLPIDLCRRIDSDNDEISRVISEGGRIYYNLPGGAPQSLIVGFVGYQQQNVLPNHPCVAWPYWEHHPCMVSDWELATWKLNPTWPGQKEIQDLHDVIGGDWNNSDWRVPRPWPDSDCKVPPVPPPSFNSSRTPAQKEITKASWARYCDAAIKLAQAVASEPNSGLTLTSMPGCKQIDNAADPSKPATGGGIGVILEPPMPFPTHVGDALGPWQIPSDTNAAEKLRRNLYPKPYVVWAASHLAFAAALGTGTIGDSYDATGKQKYGATPASSSLTTKPPFPPLVYRYYDNGPNLTPAEIEYARKTHESCRQWVVRAITANPNDWGVGRQMDLQGAWDFPLVQHDLFPSGTLSAFIDVLSDPVVVPPNPPQRDTAWRVVTSTPVINYGQARGLYGSRPPPNTPVYLPANKTNIDNGWGDPTHFHLTRRFDPTERMRQVVFWSVDWQSYEDFEELPAPPHDASLGFKDSYGIQVCADWWGISLPERGNYWTDSTHTIKAGAVRNANGTNQTYDAICETPDYKSGFFMGMFGADRNGNGKMDRGIVPKSVRLRATQIARFTIYDRVLLGEVRH